MWIHRYKIDVSEGRSKGIIINERWSVGHVVFARKFESFRKGGVRKRSCSGGTSINYRLAGGRKGEGSGPDAGAVALS